MGERMMIISYLRAMKRIINLLAFVLVLLSGISACQKRNVPPPQEELLYDVECFYQQRPDSALQILDTLNVAMLSEKEKAHYGLLKAQTILQLDFGNPEADSLLQLSADYFSRHDEPYFEALTCFNQSRLLGVTLGRETQNEKECTELMLKALHCIDACQHLDPRLLCCSEDEADKQYKIGSLRSQICMGLSSLYASTGFVEESIHYTKMADQFYADHDLSRKRIRTSFTLGNNYLELGEYDACLMYYERGLHFAETVDDDVERAYYYVATNLYYMTLIDYEQYETEEERLQLLRKAVATSRKGLEILSDSINAPLAVTFRAQLNQASATAILNCNNTIPRCISAIRPKHRKATICCRPKPTNTCCFPIWPSATSKTHDVTPTSILPKLGNLSFSEKMLPKSPMSIRNNLKSSKFKTSSI